MPPKRKETSKDPTAFTFSPMKPKQSEIVVQKPPTSLQKPKDATIKPSDNKANTVLNNPATNEPSHSEAECLILGIL